MNVFQMVIMVNGQASTIKVIQLLLNIDMFWHVKYRKTESKKRVSSPCSVHRVTLDTS